MDLSDTEPDEIFAQFNDDEIDMDYNKFTDAVGQEFALIFYSTSM